MNAKMIKLVKSVAVVTLRSVRLSSDVSKPIALRSRKPRADGSLPESFVDARYVKVTAGRGGDGCISFLQLWSNETAGPDGGDGGNGGHVIFEASSSVRDLKGFHTVLKAADGERGWSQDCCGKSGKHTVIKVPVGTVVKNADGDLVGDLNKEGAMFIAARGGAGGHGNHFFASDKLQAPHIGEMGAHGENKLYNLEVKSMAHFGLVGMPNAGKSTLLRAVSRAKPKVASYPFTTLKPHVGVIQYNDHEQISVADLPGLIEGSHNNRGLGIQFLKHIDRCMGLLHVVDLSQPNPWLQFEAVMYELMQYNAELQHRPQAVVGNKIDVPEAQENLKIFKEKVALPVIPISAKTGKNLSALLDKIREMYDNKLEN